MRAMHVAYRILFQELQHGEVSIRDLREATGLADSTLGEIMNCFTRRVDGIKFAHISGWDGQARLFSLGDKRNAPRPNLTPQAMRAKRYRDRIAVRKYTLQPEN